MIGLVLEALPPDVTVIGECDVGEQGVARLHRLHRVRVGVVVGAGSDTEETVFRVDRVETAVLAELQPGDVVTDNFGAPAIDGGLEHRQVRLAAGGRECRADVVGLALRGGELQDEHVLGHPALVAGHDGGDTQGVALLRQNGVSAVAGTVGPDLTGVRELGDVLRVVAGPGDVFLTGLQRRADGVQGVHELAVVTDLLEGLGAHAGHDAHRHHDVGGVRQLDAELRVGVADRAHAERDDVHRAALHGPPEALRHLGLHLGRIHPVVRRTGARLILGADERPGLDAGDIRGIGPCQVAVGTLLLIQLDEGARLDELGTEPIPFFLGTVSEDDPIGLEQLHRLGDPSDQFLVLRGQCTLKARDC